MKENLEMIDSIDYTLIIFNNYEVVIRKEKN